MPEGDWLILFHSLPAKPVAPRMKIWRRLQKAGALRFTGSTYLLPRNEENEELLVWLCQEVKTLGGEADFARVARTAALDSRGLTGMFSQARDQTFEALESQIEALERLAFGPPPGPGPEEARKFLARWRKLSEEQRELARIDFFPSGRGEKLGQRLDLIQDKLNARRAGAEKMTAAAQPSKVARRKPEDYQGRLWVTRARPFVDRMASAWLIRRFIDPRAAFDFVKEGQPLPPGAVGFDLAGGEFSHLGNWCTFEVLIRAFGLKGKALPKLAQLVHQLDLDDGRYAAPQALGVEEILRGVRRSVANDQEALEKGMAVFEMLYASSGGR